MLNDSELGSPSTRGLSLHSPRAHPFKLKFNSTSAEGVFCAALIRPVPKRPVGRIQCLLVFLLTGLCCFRPCAVGQDCMSEARTSSMLLKACRRKKHLYGRFVRHVSSVQASRHVQRSRNETTRATGTHRHTQTKRRNSASGQARATFGTLGTGIINAVDLDPSSARIWSISYHLQVSPLSVEARCPCAQDQRNHHPSSTSGRFPPS